MPITVLSQPPAALTRAELDEMSLTTPDSFQGIPPLLRHKQERVRVTCEPAFEGFEGGQDGELWITEGAVSFYSPADSTGLSIPFPHLTLHAISRTPVSTNGESTSTSNGTTDSPAAPATACVYCQIDETVPDADSDEMEGQTREFIIVPAESESVDKIFSLLSACAALHPATSSASGTSGLFGGLDMDSMVYADADGNLVGPGIDNNNVGDDSTEDALSGQQDQDQVQEPAQHDSEAGRVRSDFVAPETRRGPY